jgi:hypothetical protein
MEIIRYWGRAIAHAARNTALLQPSKIATSLGVSVLSLVVQAEKGIRGWPLTWDVVGATVIAYGVVLFLSGLWNLASAPPRMEAARAESGAGVYVRDPRVQQIADAREIAKRIRLLAADSREESLTRHPTHLAEARNRVLGPLARYGEIRVRAIMARDALLGELVVPPRSRRQHAEIDYEYPNNAWVLDAVADDLEMLAQAVEERMKREQ